MSSAKADPLFLCTDNHLREAVGVMILHQFGVENRCEGHAVVSLKPINQGLIAVIREASRMFRLGWITREQLLHNEKSNTTNSNQLSANIQTETVENMESQRCSSHD